MFIILVTSIYILLSLILRFAPSKYVDVTYFISVIVFLCLLKGKAHFQVDFRLVCLNVAVGLFLSFPTTIISTFIAFQKLPSLHFSLDMNALFFIGVLAEEIVWRDFLLSSLNFDMNARPLVVFLVIFVTLLFVFSHRNIRGVKDSIEMVIFSLVIVLAAIVFPGANFGLHLGRNIMCKRGVL